MNLPLGLNSVWLAVAVFLPMLVGWEMYWRNDGYPPSPDDNRHLWAETRGKIDKYGPDDFVIIGSSRALFDIQLNEWEAVTGKRPLQLAITGGTPTPVFQDIVDNSDFNGTIIFGVTPPLMFLGASPEAPFWEHPADWIDHYHSRTYAQMFNHWVGKPMQRNFSFLENDEDIFYNDLDLKTLIKRIPYKGRVEIEPPFPWFQYLDEERNTTMLEKVTADTAYAGMVKRTWQFFLTSGPPPDSAMVAGAKAAVLDMTKQYLDRFKERGGRVVFVRFPSNGWFRMVEKMGFPRVQFWDVLLQETGVPGYHFEDYDVLNKYECPEWSHLDTPDARQFTTDLASLMIRDGVIQQSR